MRLVKVIQSAAVVIVLWLVLMGFSLVGWRPGRNSIEERLQRLDSTQLQHVIEYSEHLLKVKSIEREDGSKQKKHIEEDSNSEEEEEIINRHHSVRHRSKKSDSDFENENDVKKHSKNNKHDTEDDSLAESEELIKKSKPKRRKHHRDVDTENDENETASPPKRIKHHNEDDNLIIDDDDKLKHSKRKNKYRNHLPTDTDNDETETPKKNKHHTEDDNIKHSQSRNQNKKHQTEDSESDDATDVPKKRNHHHRKSKKKESQSDQVEKHNDLKDNAVKQNPGGTEQEALSERRILSKLNWPISSYEEATWHDVDKPIVPKELLAVQTLQSKNKNKYKTAMSKCQLSHKSSSEIPSHANVDMDCFQRHYWESIPDKGSRKKSCDEIYSYPSIKEFQSSDSQLEMCKQKSDSGSSIVCNTRKIKGHSSDTPFCKSENVLINFDKMPHAQQFPWLDFRKGAFESHGCEVSSKAKRQWKGMFIQCIADWFDKGFTNVDSEPECDVTISTPTYFVTRAGDYSPFHIAHDFLNLFMASSILKFNFNDLQIVIHDRMTKGFYLPLWQWVYSSGNKLLWYPDLKDEYKGKKVCYEKAFFNVPARLSLLYNNHVECIEQTSSTMRAFSDFVLGSYNAVGVGSIHDSVVITLIARRNYKTGHSIGRRFGNEEELISLLESFNEVTVNVVDYASYDFDSQLNISRSTDLIVAMHGAGLIQMMFLPTWGSVFEFFCPEKPPSNYRYKHLAGYMGLSYLSYTLHSAQNVVPIELVKSDIKNQIEEVRQKKKSFLSEEDDDE